MFRLFRKKKAVVDPTEARLWVVVNLIKDLPRKDFNRLRRAIDKIYDGIEDVRVVRTDDERELEDVNKTDRLLDKIKEEEEKTK